MSRVHDWPERLAECVRVAMTRPFRWGEHDCVLFACDCVHAMTRVDHGARFRGKYRSARGAFGVLKRIGVGSVEELATKVLGEPIPVSRAQRGDVVLMDNAVVAERGPALGIVIGADAAFTARHGLELKVVATTSKAWRVG